MVVEAKDYITEPVYEKLRDGTDVTILPFNSVEETPENVVTTIYELFNQVIEEGKTYPQEEVLTKEQFLAYYFPHFVAVMLKGTISKADRLRTDLDIGPGGQHEFYGCFYIKPNYVGRSRHVCNGGFLVSYQHRGDGCGSVLGRTYIRLAPQLGFQSSVFNLVYETNVASCRIWERLGFEKIGTVQGAGRLKGTDGLVNAVLYGYQFSKP